LTFHVCRMVQTVCLALLQPGEVLVIPPENIQ
jgi:hypothetical protein